MLIYESYDLYSKQQKPILTKQAMTSDYRKSHIWLKKCTLHIQTEQSVIILKSRIRNFKQATEPQHDKPTK